MPKRVDDTTIACPKCKEGHGIHRQGHISFLLIHHKYEDNVRYCPCCGYSDVYMQYPFYRTNNEEKVIEEWYKRRLQRRKLIEKLIYHGHIKVEKIGYDEALRLPIIAKRV